MPIIELSTYVAASPDRCFDHALDVDVQARLDSRTRAVDGVVRGMLALGDTVTWRAIHFGVPWWMTSRITVVDRPHGFSDAMLRGPFSSWRHSHRFAPVGSGTAMYDLVEYAVPLGPLGTLFDQAVLYRYLAGLLAVRNQRLKEIVESGE